MIKRILVPLDPSPFSGQALTAACEIAKIHNAEVTGLVILDIPGIKRSIGPVPAGASYYAKQLEESKLKEAEDHIHSLLEVFKFKCKKEGINHSIHERQGIPSGKILEESKFYDLLVIGTKTYYHFETQDHPGDSFEEIMDQTVTPVLAVPKEIIIDPYPENPLKVLIAFDGDMPSCRAIHRFAQLAGPKEIKTDIRLLMSHDNKKFADHYLEDAIKYLHSHGFEKITPEYTKKDIVKYVNDNYLKWPDIYVIGPHSSKGMIDFLVGSLMKFLIRESEKPIFIGH